MKPPPTHEYLEYASEQKRWLLQSYGIVKEFFWLILKKQQFVRFLQDVALVYIYGVAQPNTIVCYLKKDLSEDKTQDYFIKGIELLIKHFKREREITFNNNKNLLYFASFIIRPRVFGARLVNFKLLLKKTFFYTFST